MFLYIIFSKLRVVLEVQVLAIVVGNTLHILETLAIYVGDEEKRNDVIPILLAR